MSSTTGWPGATPSRSVQKRKPKKGKGQQRGPPTTKELAAQLRPAVLDPITSLPKGTHNSSPQLMMLAIDRTAAFRYQREEVRRLRLRIELVDCRLRIEREERRLNETRLMAALREARRATARARADVERIAARR